MLQHLAVQSAAASVGISQDRLATAFQAIATTLRAPARKNARPRLVQTAKPVAER